MNRPDCLYIVIPCYNEEQVLPVTSGMFLDELNHLIKAGKISSDSRIMFVNDGSSDSTWDIITDLSKKDGHFIGISQSRNRGHQSSVLAGLMEASQYADMTISIDCDGQDDIHAMEDMVDAYHDGCDIVYGVRNDRSTDTFFKRNTAKGFYKIMAGLGAETVYNHADYRLLSKRVINELAQFKETNLYLRGLIPLVGFKSSSVYYSRSERLAGKSHYPFSKMLNLALNGITSLSVKPLRLLCHLVLSFQSSASSVLYGLLLTTCSATQLPAGQARYVSYASWGEYSLCASGLLGNTSGRYIWRSRIDPGLLSARGLIRAMKMKSLDE